MANVLERYRRTPGTVGHVRAADRHLAVTLWERAVPLEIINTALLLATARLAARSETGTTTPLVRSLHYFLPVIAELIANPPDPSYQRYLADKLARSDDDLANDELIGGHEDVL